MGEQSLLYVVWLCLEEGGSDWKRETDLGAKKRPKSVPQASKIQLKAVQVASQIESGGFQRSRGAMQRLPRRGAVSP